MIPLSAPRGAALAMVLVSAHATAGAQSSDSASITLFAAVRTALDAHPSVAAAHASELEAAARTGEAVAAWFPQLRVEGSFTQFQEPMVIFPLHRLDPNNFPDFNRSLVRGGVNLGYTLFDGGARGARIRAARAQQGVTEARREVAEMTLIADVGTAYLTIRSTAGVLEALGENLAALGAERDRVERLLGQGRAARVELLRVDAAIAQAEAERITAASQLDAAERTLARLLDLSPASTRAAQLAPVALADTAVPTREASLEALATTSPELRQASRAVETAQWARRTATAAWLPRLEVAGAYLLFGSGAGDFATEWQGGVRLSYPLFTGGARSKAVSAATARASQAQEQLRLTRLFAEAAVDRALTNLREHRARSRAVATAVAHLTEVARIEQLALETGVGTQTDYLRAQADLRRSRAALIEVRHAEILARMQLARATGTLSPEWLERTLETTQ